jgi:hypothetical protein
MFRHLLVFTFFILVVSCNFQLELPDQDPHKLFLYGFVHPDSVFQVRLTHSFGPLDTFSSQSSAISNARVVLLENNRAIDTLDEVRTGVYRSAKGLKPSLGRLYQYSATASGYETVMSPADSLPARLPVQSIEATHRPDARENAIVLDIKIDLSKKIDNDYVGIQLRFFETSFFYTGYTNACIGNKSLVCDRVNKGIRVNDFCVEDFYCVTEFDQISLYNPSFFPADDLLSKPATLSLATYSKKTTELAVQFGEASDAYDNNFDVNPFYSPVFLPIETQGGYAAIFFYNTHTETLKL